MGRKTVQACECNVCGHVWLPRPDNPNPVACAKCKSPYWDRPRRNDASDRGKEIATKYAKVTKKGENK